MSDDFWSSQNISNFLLGASGGFAGVYSLGRKVTYGEMVRHVVVGGMAAVVLGPEISAALGTPSAGTIWVTGVGGVGLCQGIIWLIKCWFGAIGKRIRND
jgi:hypothetical protein